MQSVPAGLAPPRTSPSGRLPVALHTSILIALLAASSAPLDITVVFSAYALALLIALLTTGTLSDHVGRRPVLLGAFAVQVASMALFATADGLTTLIGAHVLQGIATGAATSAAGAALLDLEDPARPGRPALTNSIAPVTGMAAGVLAATLMVLRPRPGDHGVRGPNRRVRRAGHRPNLRDGGGRSRTSSSPGRRWPGSASEPSPRVRCARSDKYGVGETEGTQGQDGRQNHRAAPKKSGRRLGTGPGEGRHARLLLRTRLLGDESARHRRRRPHRRLRTACGSPGPCRLRGRTGDRRGLDADRAAAQSAPDTVCGRPLPPGNEQLHIRLTGHTRPGNLRPRDT
ncbi:MFS transporter [Streptomyces bauhiniae]|uniref:MFS transporter n=1 Tax=Streptomyces bauhiniae TaxID=2340725 RepID=UPI0037F62BC7